MTVFFYTFANLTTRMKTLELFYVPLVDDDYYIMYVLAFFTAYLILART